LSTQKNYSIRRFNNSDVEGVLNLLKIVFQEKYTRDWWEWKYKLNPFGFFGEKGDIWVAEFEDQIIGHYAIIPEEIRYQSKSIKIAQSVDTATHPEFRRQGIFSNLAKKVYKEAQDRYSIIYGFPSEIAYKGFISLGWEAYNTSEYIKIINLDDFFDMIEKNFLSNFSKIYFKGIKKIQKLNSMVFNKKNIDVDFQIKETTHFNDEINTFFGKIINYYEIVHDRSSKFLNWRFSKKFGTYRIYTSCDNQGNILGYVVFKRNKKIINIVDLITLPDKNYITTYLINEIIELAEKENITYINILYPNWDNNCKYLNKLGFINLENIYKILDKYGIKFIIYFLNPNLKQEKIKNWFYTFADTDFV
jgi:predicted acetyltransferase